MNKPKEDPMAAFKNIDYGRIPGARPSFADNSPVMPDRSNEINIEYVHVDVNGRSFRVTEDAAAICSAIMALCEVMKPPKGKK